MRILILFGTESGVSEMVAEDVADAFGDDHDIEVRDMSAPGAATLDPTALHLVVCSTYGEGELPSGAEPFLIELTKSSKDLGGIVYAVFGLGDSSYDDSYSRGSEIIDLALSELGARRIGVYGRHDAAVDGDPSVIAVAWAGEVLALAETVAS